MEHITLYVDGDEKTEKLNQYLAEGWVLNPEVRTIALDFAAIYHLVKYSEAEQLALEAEKAKAEEAKKGEFDDVEAVADIGHGDVEAKVKEGYVVHAIYQKNVIMVKKKLKEAEK